MSAGHLAQTAVVGVGVGADPCQGLGDADAQLDHDHALGLEQLGAVLERLVELADAPARS